MKTNGVPRKKNRLFSFWSSDKQVDMTNNQNKKVKKKMTVVAGSRAREKDHKKACGERVGQEEEEYRGYTWEDTTSV